MILNMNNGSNRVQIIDFTLSEDILINSAEGLEIENVILRNGAYSGFAILPIGTLSVTDSTIVHIYSPWNISNVSQSGLRLDYYSRVNDYQVVIDTNSDAVIYDATNQKLKIRSENTSRYVRACDYRLVIW